MENIELLRIGERITCLRKSHGYTQEYLAEKMDVSVQMISNLERGVKEIKTSNLVKLSGILGVSTDYLLKGTPTEEDNSNLTTKIANLSEKDRQMIEMLVDYCSK